MAWIPQCRGDQAHRVDEPHQEDGYGRDESQTQVQSRFAEQLIQRPGGEALDEFHGYEYRHLDESEPDRPDPGAETRLSRLLHGEPAESHGGGRHQKGPREVEVTMTAERGCPHRWVEMCDEIRQAVTYPHPCQHHQ